jgi:hypothetical protein
MSLWSIPLIGKGKTLEERKLQEEHTAKMQVLVDAYNRGDMDAVNRLMRLDPSLYIPKDMMPQKQVRHDLCSGVFYTENYRDDMAEKKSKIVTDLYMECKGCGSHEITPQGTCKHCGRRR